MEKYNLLVLYLKNSNGLLKDLGGHEKKKNKSADTSADRNRDLTWICRHLYVCPLIDHGQQPMKCTQKSRYCINSYTNRNTKEVGLGMHEILYERYL